MGRLNRSALLHYLDATPSATSRSWYKVGKDVEDLSVSLNPETETVKNILDETITRHKGYEASADVETYYADPDDGDFYDLILGISLGRLKGDACKTKILEVVVEDTSDTSHSAWQEDVIIAVGSYGGPQGGVSIPYTIQFAGNRQAGTVAFASQTGVPTFTPAS